MFHGVSYTSIGETSYEKDVRERLRSILADQDRIAAVITKHSKMSAADVKAMFSGTVTKSAGEAVVLGMVNEVKEAAVPSVDNPVFSLVFPR